MTTYFAIRSEGGLLPIDILERVAREELPGQKARDFGLAKGRRLGDEIASAWSDAQDYWSVFKRHRDELPEGETGTTLTRERWAVRILNELLGYELTYQTAGAVVQGKIYPISHRAGNGEEAPPVHIEGFRVDLDHRPPTGHRRLSPQALIQEYLNRQEQHLWGVVTNGLILRLLRQTPITARPSYLEFDLESILEGGRYNEFVLFYRLCHRTRLPADGEDSSKCLLETYYQEAVNQGGRVRDKLRDGVEESLKIFGTGFLRHPANTEFRERLQSGKLTADRYHQQLLRLIYRLLFLMVAEERHMIAADSEEADRKQRIYDECYSVTRLREHVEHIIEASSHQDLWLGLKKTFLLFSESSSGNPLGIPPLNGDLFGPYAMPDLENTHLFNDDLIRAIKRLSLFEDNKVRRRVNYAGLDVEEMGSVYESLLDFQPAIEETPKGLILVLRTGTERKSTGSYYTRPELVRELIQSALVPVMEERLAEAKSKEEKERAILNMKICDSACGSGHFLLAAARRLGRELAKIRTGEEEPTPKEFHLAVRDVISHCIYGVDVNPLAVDLCKLSLWLEGHWTGKPLSFLDHHIKCGNSLLGVFDPKVLKEGIPDDAFKPVTGDDKKAAAAIRKRNKKEWTVQQRTFGFGATVLDKLEGYAEQLDQLSEIAEDSPADVKRKAELYKKVYQSAESHRAHRVANLWSAAFFVQLRSPDDPAVPTHERFMEFLERGVAYGPMIGQADNLALKHHFFHWFLEFPEVFANGGFDVVLGNPPWEKITLKEEEHWADDPYISNAQNKAERAKRIEEYRRSDSQALQERVAQFDSARHDAEAASKFLRSSGRFPLTAFGDINTYAVFTELGCSTILSDGHVGLLTPTGIVSDDSTKTFFNTLIENNRLVSVQGFINEEMIFPAVLHNFKFCAITIGRERPSSVRSDFVFFSHNFTQLHDAQRHFHLSPSDFRLLNPNTRTCPVFRTYADAELNKKVYAGVPIFVQEDDNKNAWGIDFGSMLHMANDSYCFESAVGPGLLPVYESKMFHQFDHRFASYETLGEQERMHMLPQSTEGQHKDAHYKVTPCYYVARQEILERLRGKTRRRWLPSIRRISSNALERTAIATVLPLAGVGDSVTLLFIDSECLARVVCLLSNLNSIVLDYAARQKVAGANISMFVLKQLPVLPPVSYNDEDLAFIAPRALELIYTAWDIKPFADDVWQDSDDCQKELFKYNSEQNKGATGGHDFNPPEWAGVAKDGIPLPPFKWDDDRRARIRAELDAYYALLYGLNRKQLRYILDPADLTKKELEDILDPWEEVTDPLDDAAYRERMAKSDFPGETFRVLKEKEMKLHGEYRTRRMVLEAFEKCVSKVLVPRDPRQAPR